VLESAEHHSRQQAQRLAVRPGHQVGDDGDFGDVELQVAHHTLEGGVRHFHVGDVEFDPAALHAAVP